MCIRDRYKDNKPREKVESGLKSGNPSIKPPKAVNTVVNEPIKIIGIAVRIASWTEAIHGFLASLFILGANLSVIQSMNFFICFLLVILFLNHLLQNNRLLNLTCYGNLIQCI